MKRDTNHSEHFCCGRNILRIPHADEFAQFHNKLFLIRLQSWLVVAVPIIRCCFDGKGCPREGERVWDYRLEKGRLFAQHTNDKTGSFEVVRFD